MADRQESSRGQASDDMTLTGRQPSRKFSYSSLVPYILLGANVDTRLYKHPSTPSGVNPSYPQELSNWYQRKHLKIVLIKNSRIKLNLS